MFQTSSSHRSDSGFNKKLSDSGGTAMNLSTERVVVPSSDPVSLDTVLGSGVSSWKLARVTGSSCQALRHAVAALNRLDDFTREKIGSGFFSEVFKVTHRTTGQVMVLKKNLLRSNRPNMLKEVQLMNQMSHPNILRFMGVCVHEGQLHALTEYLNGGSLEQLIQSRSTDLPYAVRMKLALDIARGMEYLHSRGVFHRDLTSKNVLIRRNEETGELTAVVADFGLAAKIPDPLSGYRLPTVGSPYWMSPECLKGQWYNEKSDVFSYGIVLCELIARVEADPDVLPRTQNFGLDYLAFTPLCPAACPPYFLKLAFHCCTFEPKSRPSFSEIVRKLEGMLRGKSGPAGPEYAEERAARAAAAADGIHAQANHAKGQAKGAKGLSDACLAGLAASSLAARSVEVIPSTPDDAGHGKSVNRHKKLSHRRSLSEDVGLAVHQSPSEKARCHLMGVTAKHVGEIMCREDPHYQPSEKGALNPFAALAQFRGVKKILGDKAGDKAAAGPAGDLPSALSANLACSGDLFSSCFELPSPFFSASPLAFPLAAGPGGAGPAMRRSSQESLAPARGTTAGGASQKSPRKLSVPSVPSVDLLGGARQECISASPFNAGVDMWCKVGSRWRLKSEVEAEREAGGAKRPSSDAVVDADGDDKGPTKRPPSRGTGHRAPASEDYLRMDAETTEALNVCDAVSTGMQVEEKTELSPQPMPPAGEASAPPSGHAPTNCKVSPAGSAGPRQGPAPASASATSQKAWRHDRHCHQQYLSLPSSPTFVRRRPVLACSAINPKVLTQRLLETQSKSSLPKSAQEEDSVFLGPSPSLDCKVDGKQRVAGASYPLQRRLSSSSSNLTSLLSEDEAVAGAVLGGYPSVTLRRRGSCESGFFSCLGEDYGLPGCDPLSPSDFCSGPARHTLCSSSAASSLFLLDDSAVSTTTVSSGELADLDDMAPNGSSSCGLSSRHHSLLFTAKRSSSIYTDSSEDVSSLGGDPAYWEERGFSTNPAPQQISKIVEYFERKQNSTITSGLAASKRSSTKLQPQVPNTNLRFSTNPYESTQALSDALRSSDFALLRKSLGSASGSKGLVAASPPPMPMSRPHLAKRCATQRLIICEGAVKSKLPLFDKKS